jgi:hypothetical protein
MLCPTWANARMTVLVASILPMYNVLTRVKEKMGSAWSRASVGCYTLKADSEYSMSSVCAVS